jgi:acyl-coenzyme A thioesterase PaaI-like protein
VQQGVVTAKAQVSDQTGNIFQGQATIFDENGRPVQEFSSTFKIARDRAIRGIEWGEPRKTRA